MSESKDRSAPERSENVPAVPVEPVAIPCDSKLNASVSQPALPVVNPVPVKPKRGKKSDEEKAAEAEVKKKEKEDRARLMYILSAGYHEFKKRLNKIRAMDELEKKISEVKFE